MGADATHAWRLPRPSWAFLLGAALALPGLALAAAPAAAGHDGLVDGSALLQVHEGGCGEAATGMDAPPLDPHARRLSTRIWLSAREHIEDGVVRVFRDGDGLRVEVPVTVDPVDPEVPTPACIRELALEVYANGLADGENTGEVRFVRAPAGAATTARP